MRGEVHVGAIRPNSAGPLYGLSKSKVLHESSKKNKFYKSWGYPSGRAHRLIGKQVISVSRLLQIQPLPGTFLVMDTSKAVLEGLGCQSAQSIQETHENQIPPGKKSWSQETATCTWVETARLALGAAHRARKFLRRDSMFANPSVAASLTMHQTH